MGLLALYLVRRVVRVGPWGLFDELLSGGTEPLCKPEAGRVVWAESRRLGRRRSRNRLTGTLAIVLVRRKVCSATNKGCTHVDRFKIGLQLFLRGAIDRRCRWEPDVLGEAREDRDLSVVRHGISDGLCPCGGEADRIVRYCVRGAPALLLDLVPLLA